MSYIGRGTDKISNVEKLDNITFSGSTATFNLTKGGSAFTPSSAECIRLAIDGIEQGNNYTVSGSQITFDFTPSGSSTNNWIYHIGVGVITTPADGSVTDAKIGSSAVTTAKINDSAVTTAKINDGAVTSGKIASGVIPDAVSLRPNANPLIINGNMAVAQRGTSFSAVADGVYTLDRFETSKDNDGAVTITQEALTSGNAYTNGFKTALKVDVTTADGTLASNQRLFIQQIIEAQNLQSLKFGTANAEKLTLSFWVKATKTGTNIVRMYAYDDDRSCSQSYTVSTTNTWEHKVLNFPADTTGVIDNDNGQGIQIAWGIGAGASFQSGTLATTWGANTSANDFVGQVNNLDSTSNNFHITGVQLEVGEFTSTTLPPFQHESFGNNLARCQRYYHQVCKNQGVADEGNYGMGITNNDDEGCHILMPFPTTMRTSPSSITQTGSAGDYGVRTTSTDTSTGVPVFANADKNSIQIKFVNSGHGFGTGKVCRGITITTNSFIGVEAEL